MGIMDKIASFFDRRDTKDLKIFTDVVDEKLKVLGIDISLLELEYNLRTASGEWLDEWGSWFGVYRNMDESDDSYRYRIIASLARATGTIPAIKNSILEYYDMKYGKGVYTEKDIKILEPYTLLKKFSECGEFSGIHRFQDGVFYRHHVLEITLPESVTPELMDLVNRTKAGGIKIYYNISPDNRPNDDGSDGIVGMTPPNLPMTDVTLSGDLGYTVMKYGKIFSSYTPIVHRTRSGKKILDPVEIFVDIGIDKAITHTYKEISEFWKIMCKYGHTTPVWIPKPKEDSNIFSENIGNYSGVRNGHWEYHPVEEVFKDAEDNILQLPVVQTHAYIRPAMFSRCGNGHSVGFARSGLEGENYDRNQKEYVEGTNYHDFYWKMKDWADNIVITTVEVKLEKEPEILVDKVFVTEEVQDELHFNVMSEVVDFTDSGVYGNEYPLNEVINTTEVQASIKVKTLPIE